MRIRILNAGRLAEELGAGQVTPTEKGYYLLAGFVMWTIVNYLGIAQASKLWTLFSVIEGIGVTGITVIGFSYAFQAAGGDENRDFVAQFSCLYLPVSVTTILSVWAFYWAVVLGLRESIFALSISHLQFALNLARIGATVFDLLSAISALLVQGITFYRITKLFDVVRAQRSSANLPLQSTPDCGGA